MESTKATIINRALTLFSKRGFEGVSMREIAAAVGIKAASIYNHFKNKEEIFSSIIDEMSRRYEVAVLQMQVPEGEPAQAAEEYKELTVDALVSMAGNLFMYFAKDDFASQFRRMLTAEQFRSQKAGDTFQSFYIEGAIHYQTSLFARMIQNGTFIECDPQIMALAFYSPIYLLLCKYDALPDKTDEALEIIERHVKQFSRVYGRR